VIVAGAFMRKVIGCMIVRFQRLRREFAIGSRVNFDWQACAVRIVAITHGAYLRQRDLKFRLFRVIKLSAFSPKTLTLIRISYAPTVRRIIGFKTALRQDFQASIALESRFRMEWKNNMRIFFDKR
jgi:hypothetical protein